MLNGNIERDRYPDIFGDSLLELDNAGADRIEAVLATMTISCY